MTRTGSVLFRGFDVKGVDGFGDVVRALSENPLPYTERSSPRSTIKGSIYTSTDYPRDQEIFLHNENSYQLSWRRYLFFYSFRLPRRRVRLRWPTCAWFMSGSIHQWSMNS